MTSRGCFKSPVASFAAFAASVAFVIGLVCAVQALGRGELSKYFRGPYLRGASLRLKGIDTRLEAPQCALKVSASIAAVRSEKLTVPDSHLGQVYKGSLYSSGFLDELRTFDYTAWDGQVRVWQHAVILCDPGDQDGPGQRDLCVLYRCTNELAFRNVADMEQTTAELFASLVDSRAHFGKGVYCTQHEPAALGHNTVQRATLPDLLYRTTWTASYAR